MLAFSAGVCSNPLMAKVFVHTYETKGASPVNIEMEFSRVPVAGEHFSTDGKNMYETKLVVHCPRGGDHTPQFEAEVWGHLVDGLDVMKSGSWKKGKPPIADFG